MLSQSAREELAAERRQLGSDALTAVRHAEDHLRIAMEYLSGEFPREYDEVDALVGRCMEFCKRMEGGNDVHD
jgi:hypothetical protein